MVYAGNNEQFGGDHFHANDMSQLAAAFELHKATLRKIVRRRLSRTLQSRVDVDDVLQEAFLAAVHRHTYAATNSPAVLLGWLRLILRQTIADLYRRHIGTDKRSMLREAGAHHGVSENAKRSRFCEQHTTRTTLPTQRQAREELRELIDTALFRLDPLDQAIIEWRGLEERTNQEVANLLGISEKAASIKYVRALQRMRAEFS